jgi:hypothetical protein
MSVGSEWGRTSIMSARNGDKARFGRQRKERIRRRARMRAMRKALQEKAPKSAPARV